MHPVSHIKGTTRLYGLVGDPLTTAKSPELLNRLFVEQRGRSEVFLARSPGECKVSRQFGE